MLTGSSNIAGRGDVSREKRLKAMAPKGHPTGPIGRKGTYQRSQLGAVMAGERVLTYHATKGWRNRRA